MKNKSRSLGGGCDLISLSFFIKPKFAFLSTNSSFIILIFLSLFYYFNENIELLLKPLNDYKIISLQNVEPLIVGHHFFPAICIYISLLVKPVSK